MIRPERPRAYLTLVRRSYENKAARTVGKSGLRTHLGVEDVCMKTKLAFGIAALGMVLASVPAIAHHSFAAEFDSNKPIKLTGSVTKIEWMNPHEYFYIDVKDASG